MCMTVTMCTSQASERSAREFYDTKQRAVKFYKENGIPERLEEILNSLFYENPPDVYGRLSEHFQSLSIPPAIHKLTAREVLDSRGQPTVQAEVHCIVKGLEQHLSTITMSSINLLMENAPSELKEADDQERQHSVDAAIELIHGPVTEALRSVSPASQEKVDDILCTILSKLKATRTEEECKKQEKIAKLEPLPSDLAKEEKISSPKSKKKPGSGKSATAMVAEPKEPMLPGCNAACVVSQAVAVAAAKLANLEPFEHIAMMCSSQKQQEFQLPIPMVNLLNSGKAYPGKQNLIKELLLIPKPGRSLKESLKQLTAIHHQISKLQFGKLGVASSYVNDLGGYCPQCDRPEQLLDMALEAISALKLTPGEDVYFALNCAGHEMFDWDKGKYEIVQGMLKVPDDMIEVYADLINRYPAIIAIIDPLRKQENEAWKKLCDRLSAHCFIIGDRVYPRAEEFIIKHFLELPSSAVTLKMQQMTTISDIIKLEELVKDSGSVSVISSSRGESPDSFLADLAVGIGSTFIKFGALSRGERVGKYNRLHEIEDFLLSKGKLKTLETFSFPVIKLPEPQEAVEEA